MYDLEGAVQAAITDCKRPRKKYTSREDLDVIATALDYAQNALRMIDKLKMVLTFEMVEQIKTAERPASILKK
jgi:hypothetical protein